MNNKMSWFMLGCAVVLLSGCLARGGVVQDILSGQVPYGLNAAGLNSSYPQRDFSSAQRGYSSAERASTSSDASANQAQRAFSSKNSSMSCLQNIDQAGMERRAQKATAFTDEIKLLCRQGKRDKATQRAMVFGKEMAANDPMTKEMKECLAKQNLPHPITTPEPYEKGKHQHICDSF